ncbi:MAG TPA: hypothetical protein PLF71_04365 [bacterium]|nr:hypothetical protein [bacterium]
MNWLEQAAAQLSKPEAGGAAEAEAPGVCALARPETVSIVATQSQKLKDLMVPPLL